jgi:hypothetical protein
MTIKRYKNTSGWVKTSSGTVRYFAKPRCTWSYKKYFLTSGVVRNKF